MDKLKRRLLSFDKSIPSGKEHRKEYHGGKACDTMCEGNRRYKELRDNQKCEYSESEFEEYCIECQEKDVNQQ